MPRKHDFDGVFRDLPPNAPTARDRTGAALRLILGGTAETRAKLTEAFGHPEEFREYPSRVKWRAEHGCRKNANGQEAPDE